MSTQKNIPSWKLGIAIIGSLLWMVTMVTAETVNSMGWTDLYQLISGYVLGFIIAISGFTFWEIAQGRAARFLDPHPVFRWLSYLMLAVIIIFGAISLLAEIFGNTNWAYNIGSLVGGLVVAIGLIPAIENRDYPCNPKLQVNDDL